MRSLRFFQTDRPILGGRESTEEPKDELSLLFSLDGLRFALPNSLEGHNIHSMASECHQATASYND